MARTYAGDPESGLLIANSNMRTVRSHGNPSQLAWGLYIQAEALAHIDSDQAEQVYEQTIALAGSVNSTLAENVAQVGLAALLMRAGKHEEALRAFGRSVKRWHDMQIWHQQWTTLRSLVQLLRQMGAHEEATTLLGGLISADADAYGSDANSMSEAAAALEEALGLDRFTMATRRGTAMSAEATVAFALAAVDSLLTGADCATTCRN